MHETGNPGCLDDFLKSWKSVRRDSRPAECRNSRDQPLGTAGLVDPPQAPQGRGGPALRRRWDMRMLAGLPGVPLRSTPGQY